MRPSRALILSEVKALIALGLSMKQMREHLQCKAGILVRFMADHEMQTLKSRGLRRDRAREVNAQITVSRITAGKGGDKLFGELMDGRVFDEIRFRRAEIQPRPIPHQMNPERSFVGCAAAMAAT